MGLVRITNYFRFLPLLQLSTVLLLTVGLASVSAEIHSISAREAALKQYLEARKALLMAREAYYQAAEDAPVSPNPFASSRIH